MTKREINPLHEIARLEYQYRFLYMLRDLGLKSAIEPSRITWDRYMYALGELSVGG